MTSSMKRHRLCVTSWRRGQKIFCIQSSFDNFTCREGEGKIFRVDPQAPSGPGGNRADPFQSRGPAIRSAPSGPLGAGRSRTGPTALRKGRPPARAGNLVIEIFYKRYF